MENYTFRLMPGQYLFHSIAMIVQEKGVRAGCVLSGVGRLRHVSLQFADRHDDSELDGHFEIVSMTGTISVHGV